MAKAEKLSFQLEIFRIKYYLNVYILKVLESEDLKISIWSSNWKLKKHQLADWISLSGERPIKAQFNTRNNDEILYWTQNKVQLPTVT